MKFVFIAFILACTLQSIGQSQPKFNLDFEQPLASNSLSKGWIKWGYYPLSIDSIKHTGKVSGKITSDQEGSSFGSIAYRIPANYKGKKITLTGHMKTKDVQGSHAGLLMRLDGEGTSLEFDNMKRQQIKGTNDWKEYSITLPFPEETEDIYVAGILVGKGEAWFDNFVVTIDGKNIETLEETQKKSYAAKADRKFDKGSQVNFPELTEDQIDNLALLGRVWGFLKYYHPKVGTGALNWDYELFRFLPKYLAATKNSKRDQLLLGWINKLGSIKKCKSCKETPKDAFLKPDLNWIETSNLSQALQEKLHFVYNNRHQGKHYYIGMVSRVGNPQFKNEALYSNMDYPDSGFRLLSLFRYWNMIHYFFPYKHLMDKDWNTVLKEYIPTFLDASDQLAYEFAAIQLIGDIQDTHASLRTKTLNDWKGKYFPPVRVSFVEDQLVVMDFYNPELKAETQLELGDIITQINGKKVEDIIKEKSKYYPASNEPTRLRNLSIDLLRSNDKQIKITYHSKDNTEQEVALKLYPKGDLNYYHLYKKGEGEPSFKHLSDDIGYITLKNIKDQDVLTLKKEFKNTKGIIIDIRNYPSTFVPFTLGSFFLKKSTPFVKFTKGNVNNPGEFTFTSKLHIPSGTPMYKGKVIVLVNEITQSSAEYTSMAFRASEKTTIIGSTTAGADGNVSRINLPGGLQTMISGIGIYYPDGGETQRIGIVPDIEIKPTIQGIRTGKDEVLEKAIELISEG